MFNVNHVGDIAVKPWIKVSDKKLPPIDKRVIICIAYSKEVTTGKLVESLNGDQNGWKTDENPSLIMSQDQVTLWQELPDYPYWFSP